MKKIIYFIMALALITTVAAINECKGTVDSDEVPCVVLLPNSSTACSSITITFFDNTSTEIYSQTMADYTPFLCNGTFNQTVRGTYTFSYSTGDSGSIIVEEGIKMILLLYFVGALIILLLVLGAIMDVPLMVAGSGILMMLFGLYTAINGFSIFNNLLTQGVSALMIPMGGFFFIKSSGLIE